MRFQSGFERSLGEESIDAHNTIIAINNFSSSPTATDLIRNYSGNTLIHVNITNNPLDAGSGTRSLLGAQIVQVNTSEVHQSYRTVDGAWANFSLQGIINHELVHLLTDLPDGPLHNAITNAIYAETLPGPARSDDYFDTRLGPECFLAGTMIDMWPRDISPDVNRVYNDREVLPKVWQKPIEEVTAKDWVLSYDDLGRLKPGRVTRAFQNRSNHILDVHGLMMTPGHVTYCASVHDENNRFAGKHVPVIDILRSDGALMKADGTRIRASTGCEVGSEDDEQFWVFLVHEDKDGIERVVDKCQLRFGTRWMLSNGQHFSMREYLDGIGAEIIMDGPRRGYARFRKTGVISVFAWTLSDTLPKPEDYVLQRSQVTLEDMYEADDWEAVQPQMPVPYAGEAGRSFSTPCTTLYADATSDVITPNIPISMRGLADQPTMSRKQRRAMEAKQRKTGTTTVH